MPNLFLMFGPNSAPFAGSIVHVFEAAAGYIIKCIQKMQREYIKSMVVKPAALKAWIKHVDYHMGRTTLSASCVTWFKRGKPNGRVITSWPGSAMHGYYGWEHPRFEDFEYESWLPEDDPLSYLGNGQTVAEKTDVGETTGYMDYEDLEKVIIVPERGVFPEPADHPSLSALKATGELAGIQKKTAALKEGAPEATNNVNGHATPEVEDTTSVSKLSPGEDFMGKAGDLTNGHHNLEAASPNAGAPLVNGELEAYEHNQ